MQSVEYRVKDLISAVFIKLANKSDTLHSKLCAILYVFNLKKMLTNGVLCDSI